MKFQQLGYTQTLSELFSATINIVSFAAVFRDITQCSPENYYKHSLWIQPPHRYSLAIGSFIRRVFKVKSPHPNYGFFGCLDKMLARPRSL